MTALSADVFTRLAKLIAIPDYQADPTARPTKTISAVYTGEPLAEIPVGTEQDALDAIARARKAQAAWARVPVTERARIFRKVANLAGQRQTLLMDVIQAENGKNRASAQEELLDIPLTARYYALRAEKLLAPRNVLGMVPVLTSTSVNYQPKGVVGVIAPWNYPLTLAISDAIPALLAGNAVVLKPDSNTPYTALAGAELLYDAGVPRDVFQVVPGPGGVVGTALVQNTEYLMFTGSSATGSLLGAQAGKRLIGYSAELGGKNPLIVTKTADLERSADIALRAIFSNSGQLCISIERVYIERAVYDRYRDILVRKTEAMVVAGNADLTTDMGSLSSQSQLDTVTEHVEDARAKGATVVAGGKARPDLGPYFYEPTILENVPEEALCFSSETFGPVVSLYPVDSVDEAVAKANDSDYGLNAGVFAGSQREGEAVARRIRCGTVTVNEAYVAAWGSTDAPMGGMGISGVGRRHGSEGLLKYTESQAISTQRLVHLGGPAFLPKKLWLKLLAPAMTVLRVLPGR